MGILRTLGLIGAGVWIIGKASQLRAASRASKKIDVIISGERVGFNYQGVPVTLSYIIKNPTKARMEMTSPLIKFRVGGTHLASSTLSVDDIPQENRSSAGRIKIEPFAQTGKITGKKIAQNCSSRPKNKGRKSFSCTTSHKNTSYIDNQHNLYSKKTIFHNRLIIKMGKTDQSARN